MSDDLRKWVTSGLVNGHSVSQLQEGMVKLGFSSEDMEKELAMAKPYMEVIARLKRQLNTREALLKVLDYQMRRLPHYLTPEKTRLPPFEQFLREYYYPNQLGI